MSFYTLLQSVLYLISTALLYPVMVLLILSFFWIIIKAGGCMAEWLERGKGGEIDLEQLVKGLVEPEENRPTPVPPPPVPSQLRDYLEVLKKELEKGNPGLAFRLERQLQERELRLIQDMNKLRLLIRLGPCLGLMGTLIPIGAALAGLSQGNLEQLTSNLTVAFTTTAVGLAVGGLAYLLGLIREGWMKEEIIQLEYITEVLIDHQDGGDWYATKGEKKEQPRSPALSARPDGGGGQSL